jgi:Fur family ferric uptake transcriptional regulator
VADTEGSASTDNPVAPLVADRIIAQLRAGGGRITATRRATIEVLLAGGDHRHLSADDIAAEVRSRLPDVAESTIYRTLTALEELGVVTHVHLGHGPSTFHLADQAHRHLVCHNCEKIIEVPSRAFATLSEHLAEAYGFSISNEHFALVGECQDCQRQFHGERPDRGSQAPTRLGDTPHGHAPEGGPNDVHEHAS